ncbi:MAG: GntR family transcriptional regulator [Planctomycetia bacterium]|nr:GntR family transcriptional regulator [Planctomycetia bacterium]
MRRKVKTSEVLRTIELAQRLENDINERKLKPGDTYFSTQDAAEFLGVARIYANNALRLLEKRQVIIRRQRLGALIAEPAIPQERAVRHLHFIVPEDYFQQEGAGSEQILPGLQEELPGSSISYCFIRPENENDKVADLIQEAKSRGGIEGFILVACSWLSQHVVEQSGFPGVVHGTPYAGIRQLPFIERDHHSGVRQVLKYLRSRGRRRWSLFFRERIHPGDCIFLEEFRAQREVNGSTPLFFTTSVLDQIDGDVGRAMSQKKGVDAIICTSILHGISALRTLEQAGKKPYEDIDIILLGSYGRREEDKKLTRLEIDLPEESLGHKLGKAIAEQAAGNAVANELLPVVLKLPS